MHNFTNRFRGNSARARCPPKSWPGRPGLELLDDKMQAGYARDAENDSHAAVVTGMRAAATRAWPRRSRKA